MKTKKILAAIGAAALSAALFAGCSGLESYVNPGDNLGGGQQSSSTPEASSSQNTSSAEEVIPSAISAGQSSVPADATIISDEADNLDITSAGAYCVTGELEGKISVECAGVTLYLENASLTNAKKVIEDEGGYGLTITLIGENTIENTNEDGSNAIDVAGDLVINGAGSLSITATKNGIKCDGSVSITESSVTITAGNHGVSANSITAISAALTLDTTISDDKDGLHAEIDEYDEAETEPTPSYKDGGYVYINNSSLTINACGDGIQADTFVYISGDDTQIDITAGGGSPSRVTESSSDSADGKGIKAGAIDWGSDEADLEWEGYLVYIGGGTINIDSNDDAIHSNGEMQVTGGTLYLKSGDDAMHADELMQISGGETDIDMCYEGIEAAKVEISGGTIEIESYEDGINAADGTTNAVGVANSNCHIIISGGYVSVNCIGSEGDGIDSNGTMLISGGEVYVAGSSGSSDAALDSDGGIIIDGGYVFAAGSLGMVETPASDSSQYCVSFARSQSISAGTTLYLCDGDGQVIMYFVAPRSCQSVILSCPEFAEGESYSIYGGDSLLATFTISSVITSVGSSSSISNPGGTPGGSSGSGSHGFGRR